jgi:hypothetical protein
MKVRVRIARMAVSGPAMSRRQRSNLDNQIGRELQRLLNSGVTGDGSVACRRPQPSVAGDIAAAIAAQLPPQRRGRRA